MKTKTTALALATLLTLTACGGDEEAGGDMETVNVGETYTIPENPDSDVQTTIDLTLTSYECGLKQGDRVVLYNDGSTDTERVRPELGWDYCRYDLTATNTGNVPTMTIPWPGTVQAGNNTIAPGQDSDVNMYAVGSVLHPADRLNPGTTIDYTVYRSYPSGTEPDAVEITRDEYATQGPVLTINLG